MKVLALYSARCGMSEYIGRIPHCLKMLRTVTVPMCKDYLLHVKIRDDSGDYQNV